jgi:hypothetical protein
VPSCRWRPPGNGGGTPAGQGVRHERHRADPHAGTRRQQLPPGERGRGGRRRSAARRLAARRGVSRPRTVVALRARDPRPQRLRLRCPRVAGRDGCHGRRPRPGGVRIPPPAHGRRRRDRPGGRDHPRPGDARAHARAHVLPRVGGRPPGAVGRVHRRQPHRRRGGPHRPARRGPGGGADAGAVPLAPAAHDARRGHPRPPDARSRQLLRGAHDRAADVHAGP